MFFVSNSVVMVLMTMQEMVVMNSGHLMWSWMTAGVTRLDKNPPSKPPVSPEGEVARGVNPPSLPQKEEAMDSPMGVIVPAGLEMDTGVLLQYQTRWNGLLV